MEKLAAYFAGIIFAIASFFGGHHGPTLSELPALPPAPAQATTSELADAAIERNSTKQTPASSSAPAAQGSTSTGALTKTQLLALADSAYADGNIPLGDYKYVTGAAKKGYVYLCTVHKDNPGSIVDGPWMHSIAWNYLQKVSVHGSVTWPNARFSDYLSGGWHIFSGNGLPVGHTTGVFPVASTDDAYQYDKNPNTISAQALSLKLPANPAYADTLYCIGGEVGVMLDGVPLFNAFDAGLRDAPAHELQDSCDGHPQGSGEYHYHGLSDCLKDIMVTTVLGYALDGFPITGPQVAPGKFLTTDDLDICHGITSDVTIDGKAVTTYHYVMTRDFPYSASCFRGKPVGLQVIAGAGGPRPQGRPRSTDETSQSSAPPQHGPPQEAIRACSGESQGDTCSFSTPTGIISGHCDTPPGSSLACVPR